MKIATWNVNSIRARLEHLQQWTALEDAPDVILLQELKVDTPQFPHDFVADCGYNVAAVGQKTYNGVAILSKAPIEDVVTVLPGDVSDAEARYIEAFTGGVRVVSVYVPNGQSVDSPKFVYKLRFLERLTLHLETLLSYDERVVIGGDFNIAPEDRDTYDPEAWQDQVLCTPEERTAFQRFLDLGYTDAWRHHHPETTDYSWWDYRAGQWRRNQGLRIDHLLLNAAALAELTEAGIDRTPRGWERPSDHTPVWVRLR